MSHPIQYEMNSSGVKNALESMQMFDSFTRTFLFNFNLKSAQVMVMVMD